MKYFSGVVFLLFCNLVNAHGIIIKWDSILPARYAEELQVSDDYPIYNNDVLFVPRVDTLDRTGRYQDIKFTLNQETGEWILSGIEKITGQDRGRFGTSIDDIEVFKSETMPVQVILKIKGRATDDCRILGRVTQKLVDEKKIEISVYDRDSPFSCEQNSPEFNKVLPLDIYGFKEGAYEIIVNNGEAIEFTLDRNNKVFK